jgi:cytochrome c55X
MADAAEISAQRQAELRYLLEQDCGSCHGLTLQGGLGPALTPQALRGKPSALLAWTITHGRPGTAMPAWQPFLAADEVDWLVEILTGGGS